MATDLVPPQVPTFYFIGMTTARSSIMKVFPAWMEHLGLQVPIVGVDCAWHDDPARYRDVVTFIKEHPNALGGLVTTHKIDLLNAARDLFDGLGRYADLLGEVSSISKRGDELWGQAKDPITSGLALEAFLPDGHSQSDAALCILGAGGSSLALTTGATFPERGYVWEFNYRGDLLFLEQAGSQQDERALTIEDGWVYFIHGWTRVMEEVLHIDIPTSGPAFDELSRVAAEARAT